MCIVRAANQSAQRRDVVSSAIAIIAILCSYFCVILFTQKPRALARFLVPIVRYEVNYTYGTCPETDTRDHLEVKHVSTVGTPSWAVLTRVGTGIQLNKGSVLWLGTSQSLSLQPNPPRHLS